MAIVTLFLSLAHPPEMGLSTMYGDANDRYNPYGQYACKTQIVRHYGVAGWQKQLALGFAHRTLPCGTKVLLCTATGHCSQAYVVDRGPYGALDPQGHWRPAKTLRKGEKYRGIADLLPPLAKSLHHTGLETVVLWQ